MIPVNFILLYTKIYCCHFFQCNALFATFSSREKQLLSKFKESLYVLVNSKKKRENVDTFFALFPERLVTGLDVLSIFHYTERDVLLQMKG